MGPAPILIVDDDKHARHSLAKALETNAFQAHQAASGIEAVQMAQVHYYPVVITDLTMPDMDGIAVIDRLRSLHPHMAFIVLAGTDNTSLPARKKSAGCPGNRGIVSVLNKPCDEDELICSVKRALNLIRHDTDTFRRVTPSTQVLLIDSITDDAQWFERALSDGGKRKVTVVPRLADALTLLREQTIDIVLSEISLPDARGLDCVTRIQQINSDVAIVVLSNIDDEAMGLHAIELGAQDYLVKSQTTLPLLERCVRYAIERKHSEKRLARLAHFDPLTGLANRTTFRRRLTRSLTRARRDSGHLALMFLDLDHFKRINDTLGHQAGDDLLQEAARRLRQCLREYDTIARLGGDEFAIVLENASIALSREIAQRIVKAYAKPFLLNGNPVDITISAGIATFPTQASTAQPEHASDLLANADAAMYVAKSAGRNGFHVFGDPENNTPILGSTPINNPGAALEATQNRRLVLHYQPQWDLRRTQIVEAEALLRLEQDDGTFTPAKEFISTLERSDLTIAIGDHCLETACQQAVKWHEAGHSSIRVSVNLSARHFAHHQRYGERESGSEGIVTAIERILAETKLPASALQVEISDEILVRDLESTRRRIRGLRERGIRVAIDDFGASPACSLAYLDEISIDLIKMSASLTRGLSQGEGRRALVEALIGLAHRLGVPIGAKGIETEEELEFLCRAGCDFGQGHLLGTPQASLVMIPSIRRAQAGARKFGPTPAPRD